MSDPFTREPDPFEVTVTARVVGQHGDGVVVSATVENGIEADGGEVGLHVSASAMSAYGLDTCVAEVERFLNATLRPEFRLGAALAMGEHGAFAVVTTGETGPRVVAPPMPTAEDLAA